MPKHKDPFVVALLEGNSYLVTISDGGDLASIWHLLKEMDADLAAEAFKTSAYSINHGKEHIGQLATMLRLFEEL